jgi:hypothetical protein
MEHAPCGRERNMSAGRTRVPIVLLATTQSWPPPARMVSGLDASGCRVDALCPRAHPMRGSDHLGRVTRYRPLAAYDSWREAIERSNPDLIVPCDDQAVAELVGLHEKTRHANGSATPMTRLIEKSLGRPDEYTKLLSRTEFIAIARELGIRAPEMRSIESEARLSETLAEWHLPLVMKRDHTSGGTGIRIVMTREQALDTWREWRSNPRWNALKRAVRGLDVSAAAEFLGPSAQPTISVQRFVAGTPATTVFAAWKGRVVATAHFEVLVTERDRGPSCVVRRIHRAEMTAAAEKVAAHFGLSGLHGLDYMLGTDGAAHLIEINPRATATCNLSFGPGHDALAALAECISEAPVPARPAAPGDLVALYPNEMMRDPASPYLTLAHHDIPVNDPGVRDCLLRHARKTLLRKRIRRFLKPDAPRPSAVSALSESRL